MPDRLEVEDEVLARSFRFAPSDVQRRVTEQMVERALEAQEPPLELPSDPAALDALLAELDASHADADFRRARAATAAQFMRRGAYEDALYEALHASVAVAEAVRDAAARLASALRSLDEHGE